MEMTTSELTSTYLLINSSAEISAEYDYFFAHTSVKENLLGSKSADIIFVHFLHEQMVFR